LPKVAQNRQGISIAVSNRNAGILEQLPLQFHNRKHRGLGFFSSRAAEISRRRQPIHGTILTGHSYPRLPDDRQTVDRHLPKRIKLRTFRPQEQNRRNSGRSNSRDLVVTLHEDHQSSPIGSLNKGKTNPETNPFGKGRFGISMIIHVF
jgi:hypothetical protein